MTVTAESLWQYASFITSTCECLRDPCLTCWFVVSTDSSDKLRQPKIGALMKQVMGGKEDVPGTFSRGGETLCVCMLLLEVLC